MSETAEGWKERATPEERRTCPTCGISRYWLARAHPNNRPQLDKCPDPFHHATHHGAKRSG